MQLRIVTSFLIFILGTAVTIAQVSCPENLPFTLQGNTEYCVGTPGVELSVPESYNSYEWLPTTETSQNVLLTAGDYELVVTHYTGCTDTLEFEVEQVSNPPQPTVTASGPLEFCEGEGVTLSGPEGYPYYEWSSGSISRNITVYETGDFLISVEDWLGCTSSSNVVQVIVDPQPIALFSPNLDMFDIQFNNLSVNAASYEWNFGDGNTSTDVEPTYSYSTSGYHEMYLVAANDCGNDTMFLELNSVDINEISDLHISIYPNPTEGLLTLNHGNELTEEAIVTLTDLAGKIVSQPVLIEPNNTESINLDYSSIKAGVYLISVKSDSKVFGSTIYIQ